jgi:predicted dehydrogenase
MSEKLKIGLIGAGDIGTAHVGAAAELDEVEFCVASGRNPDRARGLASATGATLYDSVDAMLDDASIQGIDICVPNHLHRECAERAFGAGKHVLCEKPIALTLEDADAMISAARSAGRILFVGHVLRFWPEYARAKKWVDSEGTDNVLVVSARRLGSLLAATTGAEGWRHNASQSGGAVIDLQIHDVDFLNWTLGDPVRVQSQGVLSADGAISYVTTAIDFANGAKGFIEASFMFKGNPLLMDFRVLSQERSVEYLYRPMGFGLHGIEAGQIVDSVPSLEEYSWGKEKVPLFQPTEDSFRAAIRDEVAHFVHCIRDGENSLIVRPEEARKALEVCLCSKRSCEEGIPVEI